MVDKIEHYSLKNPASVYDEESLTALELAGRTAAKVNECVEKVNENTEALPSMVDGAVQNHIDAGYFDTKIDEHQQALVSEIEENRLAMQNQLGNKVDKGASSSITMTMLAQEVKTAMTGGSVAVVGVDGVATNHIQNEAVAPGKLKPIIEKVDYYGDLVNPVLTLNSIERTATVTATSKFRLITQHDYIDIQPTEATTAVNWKTATFMVWFERNTNTFHISNALNFYYDYYLVGYYYSKDQYEVVFPIEIDGALLTPNKKNERTLSHTLIRPFNTDDTGMTPYIDFTKQELVIPQFTILYGLKGADFKTLVNTEAAPLHVPFAEGEHHYLVGKAGEIKFISATDYRNATSANTYPYTLGYVESANHVFSMTFPCERMRTISVLGDSISTFNGYNPAGNAVYYDGSGSVNHVYFTWWNRLMNRCGLALNTNNSWSGAKVSGTGVSAAHIRATQLDNGTDPDIITVFMGVNDFNNNVPLGNYDGRTVPVSASTFREAYALTLKNILSKYKSAKVYAMTLPACQRTTDEIAAPEINAAGVGIWEYNKAIREIAEMFHVEVIDTATCQINNYNGDVNMVDYTSGTGTFLHPNKSGHKKIADKAIKAILHSGG